MAAEEVRIDLPGSDVVTGTKPFVVSIGVPEALAAKGPLLTVELRRVEPGLAESPAVASEMSLPAGACRVLVDGSSLAEGLYAGTIAVAAGEARRSAEFTMFRMPEGRPQEFPYGTYAVPFHYEPDPATRQRVPVREQHKVILRDMKAAGLNLICQHMNGMQDLTWTMDQAAREGMWFMPSTNVLGHGMDPNADVQAVRSDGKPVDHWLRYCMFSPRSRRASVPRFQGCLREFLTHPAFSGKLYYGDDLCMPSKLVDGKVLLTCYCAHCKEGFRARTGKEPPTAVERTSGVVPADHPWLQWQRFRCGEVFGGYLREIEQAKNQVAPAVQIGPIHGWSEQPFTRIETGIYPPLQQTTTAVSSYVYPNLTSPRMDFICQYELARMGQRHKDVWMLGQISMDAVCPPWRIYQNYWNMLAAGYRLIAYFSWGGFDMANWEAQIRGKWMPPMKPEDWDLLRRHMELAKAALARCGQHKEWVLPVALYWSPAQTPDAVLYSFTTEAFDLWPEFRGKKHMEEITLFYREALRQHVPMKVICEEEIRGGMLDQLNALCLYDARVLPDDVVKAIEQWAAKGGKLYVHDEAALKPKGAMEMSMETMITLLGDRAGGVRLTNRDVTVRELRSGDARYYVFVNNYTDRYWGLVHHYGRPGENYADLRIVRDEPADTTVRFPEAGRFLFDMSTGMSLGSTKDPLRLALKPSWGLAVISLPTDAARLKVSGPGTTKQSRTATYEIEMLDAGGKRVKGAFAVRVAVRTPSGRTSRYSCSMGIAEGAGQFHLPIGGNDELGRWQVTLEGGFPRTAANLDLDVAAGPEVKGIVNAQAAVTPAAGK
jgi:hypothetical protein